MKVFYGFSLLTVLLLSVLQWNLRLVYGWWDESHMTIAAIGKLRLTDEEVAKIEGVLAYWDLSYPGFSSIPVAAVWADHIKCGTRASFCDSLERMDHFVAFNIQHYTSNIYNVSTTAVPSILDYFPLPNHGAVYFLKQIWNSMKIKDIENFGDDEQRWGSPEVWNIAIRMLTHILGDIHQPLHNILGVSDYMPGGDSGGSVIKVKYEYSGSPIRTLHAFWDAAGAYYAKSFPAFGQDDALATARELMEAYPYESLLDDPSVTFFDPINENFEEISKMGASLAHEVYDGINFSTTDYSTAVYEPTEEYTKNTQSVSRKAIAIGGYSMGIALKHLARAIPDLDDYYANPSIPTGEGSHWYLWFFGTLLVVIIIVNCAYFFYLRYLIMRNYDLQASLIGGHGNYKMAHMPEA